MRTTQLRALEQALTTIDATGPAAAATEALLTNGPAQSALVLLVSAVLRLRPSDMGCAAAGSKPELRRRVAALTLRVTGSYVGQAGQNLVAEQLKQAMCGVLRALLRTQALQAASRQLAALAEPLAAAARLQEATSAGGAAAEHAAVAEARAPSTAASGAGQQERPWFAPSLLEFVYRLITSVIHFACARDGLSGSAESDQLRRDLLAAMEDSGVLEHAARALLLTVALAPGSAANDDDWLLLHRAVHRSSCALVLLADTPSDDADADEDEDEDEERPDDVLQPRFSALLSGRCVRHAAMVCGLATLCAADGGPAYGLPPGLLARMIAMAPIRYACGAQAPLENRSAAAEQHLRAMVRVLAQAGAQAPPGRRAALAIIMRIGWLAVRAVAAGGAAQCGHGGGASSSGAGGVGGSSIVPPEAAGAPERRLVLLPGDAARLAGTLLQLAWDYPASSASAELQPARAVEEATEWWRLAVAVVSAAAPHVGREVRLHLGHLLAHGGVAELAQGVLFMPPAPPLMLSTALAGGLLPWLERLLRAAGQAPAGPEADLACGFFFQKFIDVRAFMAALLAYGEPRQAAALVVTMGKLLRRADPRVFIMKSLAHAHPMQACAMSAANAALHLLFMGLHEPLAGTGSGPAGPEPEACAAAPAQAAPPGGPSAASQQLASVLSCAVCVWLPAAAAVARRALVLLGELASEAAPGDAAASDRCSRIFTYLLQPVLSWLPPIAARCGRGAAVEGNGGPGGPASMDPAAAGSACAASAAAAECGEAEEGAEAEVISSTADGDGGWSALLLEEVGAVPLLGAALELAPRLGEVRGLAEKDLAGFLRWTVRACQAVAVVCVQQAGSAAAAAATPTAVAASEPRRCSEAAAEKASSRNAASSEPASITTCAVGPGAGIAFQFPWQPEHLRAVAARLRSTDGAELAAEADELAAWLERRGVAGDEGAPVLLPADPMVAVLPPPVEARRLLRTCTYPGCTNLDGDSEAGLPLKGCSGCGAAGYCGRPCQTAHWRAGHKRECEGRQRIGV